MKRLTLLIIILSATCHISKAQEDWGSATSFEISQKIFNNISLSIEEELRLRDKFSSIDRFGTSFDLGYKPFEFLKIGTIYNPIIKNHEKRGWELRHRYYLYLTGSYTYKNFSVSLRERFQSTYRVGIDKTRKRANPRNYLCSRLKIEYNIKKYGLEPHVSFEFFRTLNNPIENSIDKLRYVAGISYKINKKNNIDLFYRYTTETEDDEIIKTNMIGLGYALKF